MSILVKGTDFGPTEQVTSTKLDNLVDAASFTNTSEVAVNYTGSTGTCLQGGGLEVTSAGQLQVKDGEITTAKLNDNAVTTAKITDLNVTTAKIAADAITTAKIADDVELGGNPTTTTQAAGNNTTRIATTEFVTTAVSNNLPAVYKTSGSTRSGASYYFTSGITEVIDPNAIVTQSGGLFTFHEAGTYLVELTGKFVDLDSDSGDRFGIQFVNNLSSTTNLQEEYVRLNVESSTASNYQDFSISIVRTVSDASTDKLAVYIVPISSGNNTEWEAKDCVFKITQLS